MKFLLLMSFYLLGSARGASGQPDEPPGSMAHQASVQQFSGEYSVLAKPSEGEASSGKNTSNEHASGGHTSSERALVEHGSSEQASDEPASGKHTAESEHAAAEHTSGELAAGAHTSGEPPTSEQPLGEKPSGEQPSGERPADEQPAGEQPAGEQPAGEQPLGEQASGEKPSDEKQLVEQPSDSPPSSTISGSVLSCHTCSYMNDQGKCLRGEGICSTQNSQQCMLKKIFEGEKLQFMVQGCENMCPSMNLFSHGTRMQIICCRNQSFCNQV